MIGSDSSSHTLAKHPGLPLAGRSAIITGGTQGLGREIASHFVGAGSHLFLIARSREAIQETISALRAARLSDSQIVAGDAADIGDRLQVSAAVAAAQAELPRLDILVNNAGVQGPIGRLEDNDIGEWEAAIRTNLLGTVAMCQAVLPAMKARGYGKIINLSGGGATAPRPHFSAYAASKAAVVRFTETLAEEVGEAGIDVNAIAPGALNTRLLEQVLSAGPERVGEKEFARSLEQRDSGGAPLAKGAALAVFLASAASDGITGKLLSAVWDDWAALPERRETLRRSDVFTLRRIVPEDRKDQWRCA